MRVALVTQRSTRDDRAARRVGRLGTELADAGHDVVAFCDQWWDGPDFARETDGVSYQAITVADGDPSLFATALVPLLWRASPDVIVAAADPPWQVVGATVASRLSRTPVVVDWFGEAAVSDPTWRHRFAARRPDLLVAPSRTVKTRLRELGAATDAISVIPEPVDMARIRETDPADGAEIVYARRLDEHANVESLLLSLAELRERDWRAVIIGDGPRREEYAAHARELRIDDRVEFLGDVDRETRIATYRNSHVFVQTATRECFADELLWALACGCVGVVEYQAESAAHELIEQEDRGIRVSGDAELTDAIRRAGEMERRDVDEDFARYDRAEVLETYLECFEDAVGAYGLF